MIDTILRKERALLWALAAIPVLFGCPSEKGKDTSDSQETESGGETTLPPEMLEGTSEVLLLDDFEDGDAYNDVDGLWLTYDDRKKGGDSEVWPPPGEFGGIFVSDEPGYGNTGRAAHLMGRTSDLLGWDYVALMTDLGPDTNCPLAQPTDLDLNAYDGLQFMAKGRIAGGSLLFRIFHFKDGEEDNCENGEPETLTNWADYMAVVQTNGEGEWSLVRIPFESLRQPDWAAIWVSIEEVLTHAKSVAWHFEGAGGEVDFWLDNLSLFKSASTDTDTTPDMEIHAPEPPEDAVIESIDIANPLQNLAESSLNRGYNITNWLEQDDYEGFDEYNEAFVAHLAANGFESLRLPIDLDRYIENRTAYFEGKADFAVSSVLFEILDAFEAWTASHGLSLTIDYHQYDNSMDLEDPRDVAAAVALWSAVAEHFKGNPREDLFFELLNEPELSVGVDTALPPGVWTAAAEQIIDAIRAHNTQRVIIFGDVDWYHIASLITRTPFPDPRMIYAIHFYDPLIFTHQGATWSDMGTVHDVPYPYTEDRWSVYFRDLGFSPEEQPEWIIAKANNYYKEGNKPVLRNALIEAKKWAVEHNVPVICNEFGVLDRTSREEDRIRYYTDVVGIFEELEIPWQHWFQIMDKETGEIDPELQTAFGLTSGE